MSSSDLLTTKELAAALKRSRWYVAAMKRAGFQMPGGTATLEDAKGWLERRPAFNSKAQYRSPVEAQKESPLVRQI